MLKIENGQLVIIPYAYDEVELAQQIANITEWKNAILELLKCNIGGKFEGGTMIWIAEMLEEISPNAEQLSEWISACSKTHSTQQ